jgi:hypothetical protein
MTTYYVSIGYANRYFPLLFVARAIFEASALLGTLATFFGVRWFQGITESGTGFPDGCQTGLLAFTGVFSNADNLGTNASPKNASFSCICYVTFYALKKLALAQSWDFHLLDGFGFCFCYGE